MVKWRVTRDLRCASRARVRKHIERDEEHASAHKRNDMQRCAALRRRCSDRQGRLRSVCCAKRKKMSERERERRSIERRKGRNRVIEMKEGETTGIDIREKKRVRGTRTRVPSLSCICGIDQFEPLDLASSGLEYVAGDS